MDLSRKDNRVPIARRMGELRKKSGLTQEQCAAALGVEQHTYSRMENSANPIRFRRRDLVTLAVLFGMEPDAAFPDFFAADPVAA